VTHCILLQAIIMVCENRPMSTLRTGQAVDQTTIFHLRWDGEKWDILIRNQPANANSSSRGRLPSSAAVI